MIFVEPLGKITIFLISRKVGKPKATKQLHLDTHSQFGLSLSGFIVEIKIFCKYDGYYFQMDLVLLQTSFPHNLKPSGVVNIFCR